MGCELICKHCGCAIHSDQNPLTDHLDHIAEPETPAQQPDGGAEGLKSCPFCGGHRLFSDIDLGGTGCNDCKFTIRRETTELSVTAWNTRAIPTDRHTSDNAHPCCEHDPTKKCCANFTPLPDRK